jgi:alpha-mannosidase
MRILNAGATPLFIGSEDEPRQVVEVTLRGSDRGDDGHPARVMVRAEGVSSDPVTLDGLAAGEQVVLEIGVVIDAATAAGTTIPAEVIVEQQPSATMSHAFDLVVAEPGWRMFMISHFHYDPVWWNTQAAYTESWGDAYMFRSPYQEPGLALVQAHLDMARRDPDYRFVLAELDYLKPYWDAYPEDRSVIRDLLAQGRLELVGGTYNEPNTNLTSAETTIRNAIYGVGYQRDVLGASPATAWQLDAFGHDPQFPGIMAAAGLTSSSWARGPFHEWGPNWRKGPAKMPPVWSEPDEPTAMQFPSEFEWISPSGGSLLTCFMANHYSAGWWMDSAPTLEDAEREVLTLFKELAAVAATRNVLLPVGTDYSPPNRWLTAVYRDWRERYVWPKFLPAVPRDFFDAVTAEQSARGRRPSPQTRDMNPIYTGKDVSFIDTKQAQRVAENTLLAAEKFASLASLLGARYPSEAIDKAWRHLLFGAHHDGITGSESDQVYLDLLAGWREAMQLSSAVLDGALMRLGTRIDTAGPGRAVTVFNPLSWTRTDVCHAELTFHGVDEDGFELRDEQGETLPFVVEAVDRREDGKLERVALAFIARDVPGLGYRTYRAVASPGIAEGSTWSAVDGTVIENEHYRVEVDPARGGAISSLLEKGSGKQILRPGSVGNELLAYSEYQNHPLFGEGPWHLTPDGRRRSAADAPASTVSERSPIGTRIRASGPFEGCEREQVVTLWQGIDRVDLSTYIDGFHGQDVLFRVRFGAQVEGATAISETADATVGRPFGFPNVDVARQPFTLDHPAYDWFALSTTLRVALTGDGAGPEQPRAARALSVAEVIGTGVAAHDEHVRDLMIALVRQGVTATLGTGDGSRYGSLAIDSNLPDFRFAIGGPEDNRFTSRLLEAVDPGYAAELQRQLSAHGRARVWVPAEQPLADTWRVDADLRGMRRLPTLIIAAVDEGSTTEAIDALAEDIASGVVIIEQPAELDGATGSVEDYTVAVLNRGLPGFSVEPVGDLYLSLMRACSGWPSGVWIDPPRRTLPDGSNFQFEHWSHRFDYAVVGRPGDWRTGQIVRTGHELNNPLVARILEAHEGDLPASTTVLTVEPSSVVLTTMKPAGDPLAHGSAADLDPGIGLALRAYESSGRPTRATVGGGLALSEASLSDVLEESRQGIAVTQGGLGLDLQPYQIATIVAHPASLAGLPLIAAGRGDDLVPRGEPAQPVFADYWLHNRGPAPMGYRPLAVHIRPDRASGPGPFSVPISVASSRTDLPIAGTVTVVPPPGWSAEPSDRPFKLAPGAHLSLETSIRPPEDAPPGRYFAAARIVDEAGQVHEDVITLDLVSAAPETTMASDGSAALASALRRTRRRHAETIGEPALDARAAASVDAGLAAIGEELVVELLSPEVRVPVGQRGELRVRLRNTVASEIRGEAQLISPHDTWPITTPWTTGFAVPPGDVVTLSFAVAPPTGFRPGSYWGLVKVMYFGRIFYTEAAVIEVSDRATT